MKKLFLIVLFLILLFSTLADIETTLDELSFTVNGQPVQNGADVYVPAGMVLFQIANIASDYTNWGVPFQWVGVGADGDIPGIGPTTVYNENLNGIWTVEEYGLYGGTFYWYVNNPIPSPGFNLSGPFFDFTLYMDQGTATPLVLYDWDFVQVWDITLIAVPEPVTMSVLGLGGLFLIRGKSNLK